MMIQNVIDISEHSDTTLLVLGKVLQTASRMPISCCVIACVLSCYYHQQYMCFKSHRYAHAYIHSDLQCTMTLTMKRVWHTFEIFRTTHGLEFWGKS